MTPALTSLISRARESNGSWARRCIEIALVLALSAQLVRLFLILLGHHVPAPMVTPTAARAPDAAILSRFDPFNREAVVSDGAAAGGQGLKLFGVRTGPGGGAIIAGPDGVQKSYGVGDEVQPGLVLSAVQGDHVVLTRAGVGGMLYFDAAAPSQAPRELVPPPPPSPPTANPMAPATPPQVTR